jgi:hypothetical protein
VTHSLFRNCTRKEEDNVYMGGVLKSSSLRLGQCGVLYMCVRVCVCVCVVYRWTCNRSRNFVECYPHPITFCNCHILMLKETILL